MATMPINVAEADLKNYFDVIKKIKELEAKETLTIEEKEQLRFYRASKLRQGMMLEGFYGYHPDDDAIETSRFSHNDNYTECEHNGIVYQFTFMQANAVKFMHEEILATCE